MLEASNVKIGFVCHEKSSLRKNETTDVEGQKT